MSFAIKLKASLLGLLITVPLAAAPAQAQESTPQSRALEVLERTKLTRATYSLYLWTRLTPPGEPPRETWAAEFHSGDLHRVETPDARVVADCRAGTGAAVSMVTGESTEGPGVARVACGINTNRVFDSAEYRGTVQTNFGPADRVRLVDDEMIRQYDVSPDGVLLRTTFAENSPGEPVILVQETVALLGEVPDADMFDRESLGRSYVPEAYRQPPPDR